MPDALEPYLASTNETPPRRLGQRYGPGGFLPEPGNTIVCHLDQNDPTHLAVIDARKALQSLPGAEALLFTPIDSLHMTVFEGVIDTRRTYDAWPLGVDASASIDDMTALLSERLQNCPTPPNIRMRLSRVAPSGLQLEGATPDDDKALRQWRDALTKIFGYRHKGHNHYRFHMTFAYPLDWLPDHLAPQWRDALAEIGDTLQRAAPIIPLHAPAFCTFPDMTRFDPVLRLG